VKEPAIDDSAAVVNRHPLIKIENPKPEIGKVFKNSKRVVLQLSRTLTHSRGRRLRKS
jgi:hypothetical protein